MKRAGFVALCLMLAIGFAALGAWQVERRAWKLELIERVEARLRAAPTPLPAVWTNELAYTRVQVRGAFLHDRETLVQAVTERGPGWWVMTPLRHERGTVLVNRGFVPAERRDPAARRASAQPGQRTVIGLLRASEPDGAFLRSNDPSRERWYSRDIVAIARARALDEAATFFIDADATPNPGGFPVGGLTVVAFRNHHLIYAITWFALAGLSMFGAVLAMRRLR